MGRLFQTASSKGKLTRVVLFGILRDRQHYEEMRGGRKHFLEGEMPRTKAWRWKIMVCIWGVESQAV